MLCLCSRRSRWCLPCRLSCNLRGQKGWHLRSWVPNLGTIFTMMTGAHNTIVTSRAGKDLVSCLVSGLLTIGPRFGGAIDDAARYFQDACDRNLDADEFVEEMKKKGIRVPGIGHRIKSKAGPIVSGNAKNDCIISGNPMACLQWGSILTWPTVTGQQG